MFSPAVALRVLFLLRRLASHLLRDSLLSAPLDAKRKQARDGHESFFINKVSQLTIIDCAYDSSLQRVNRNRSDFAVRCDVSRTLEVSDGQL